MALENAGMVRNVEGASAETITEVKSQNESNEEDELNF